MSCVHFFCMSFLLSFFDEKNVKPKDTKIPRETEVLQRQIFDLERQIESLRIENAALTAHAAEAVDTARAIETSLVTEQARNLRKERILEEALCRVAAEAERGDQGDPNYRLLLAKIFLEFPQVRNKYGPRLS